MDDDDYRALIERVRRLLRQVGEPDLADLDNYVRRDPETGEIWRSEPKKQLIEMLEAFDRHLITRDRGTYTQAINALNGSLYRGEVREAVIAPTAGAEDELPVSLANVPDLSQVRSDLRWLIMQLIETPGPLEGSRLA